MRSFITGALIVLFNPSEDQITNVIRTRQRCTHLVAVDNSMSVNADMHARMRQAGVDLIPNLNRGGIAGAYNRGLEFLIGKGAELLFLFDQDSEIPENYFAAMTAACGSLETPCLLAGPRVLDVNVNRYVPVHLVSKFGIKPVTLTGEEGGLLRCSSIISSGSVMSADTYRRLGPFLEDYFIDHIDTEYCFRAVTQEVPIYVNASLTLRHQISRRIDHRFLFITLFEWNMAPPRQYYSARNCIHITRRYGTAFPILVLINIITLQQIVSILLFERNKYRKLLAMLTGIADGLRRRSGPFETCWPRFANVCTRSDR
jgi:rhamnosyltransferase